MGWIHGWQSSCMFIREPFQKFLIIWNNFFLGFWYLRNRNWRISEWVQESESNSPEAKSTIQRSRFSWQVILVLWKSLPVINFIEKTSWFITWVTYQCGPFKEVPKILKRWHSFEQKKQERTSNRYKGDPKMCIWILLGKLGVLPKMTMQPRLK